MQHWPAPSWQFRVSGRSVDHQLALMRCEIEVADALLSLSFVRRPTA